MLLGAETIEIPARSRKGHQAAREIGAIASRYDFQVA